MLSLYSYFGHTSFYNITISINLVAKRSPNSDRGLFVDDFHLHIAQLFVELPHSIALHVRCIARCEDHLKA